MSSPLIDGTVCRTCGLPKLVSDFYKSSDKRCKACEKSRTADYRRRRPETARHAAAKSNQRLRDQLLDAYGAICACCGERERSFLTLDHVGGGGSKHRKFLQKTRGYIGTAVYRDVRDHGYPKDKYRLLCMNCNFATRYGKPCPHELQRSKQLSRSSNHDIAGVVSPLNQADACNLTT